MKNGFDGLFEPRPKSAQSPTKRANSTSALVSNHARRERAQISRRWPNGDSERSPPDLNAIPVMSCADATGWVA